MHKLTEQQTMQRYRLTLREWESLTEGQRAGYRATESRKRATFCECSNIATVMRSGRKICQRCADIETRRGQRFNGLGIGESCGVRDGYDPFTVNI